MTSHGGHRSGSGRRLLGRVEVTIRIPRPLANLLDRAAFLTGRTRGEVIEALFTPRRRRRRRVS